jgi:acyl-CoA thioesterase
VEQDARDRAEERSFLGMEMDDGAMYGVLPVSVQLCTRRDTLYGGSVHAAVIAAMETATRRRAVWATTQLVGTATVGERIELRVDELARSGRTSQVSLRGTTASGVVFAALGATGDDRTEPFTAQYGGAPKVPEPDDCPVMFAHRESGPRGYQTVLDLRAAGTVPGSRPPAILAWARTPGRRTTLPAMIATAADQLPFAVAHLAGVSGAGASLDNTLRVGPRADHEWVLLELRPDLGGRGYGHGSVWVWSPDGVLLAVGSQSSVMRPGMEFAIDAGLLR